MSEAQNINVFDVETLLDPYAAYKTLRDEAPVYFMPEMNLHYVTRYDLVREALKDTSTYSSRFDAFMNTTREAGLAMVPADVRTQIDDIARRMVEVPPTMLTLDEPDHTKYRSLVSALFTGSQVKKAEDQVREVVERTADAFVSALSPDGAVDFMEGFAGPVPLEIIGDRLGIPKEDREFFDEAATVSAAALRMSPLPPQEMLRRAQVQLDLQELLIRVIEARRQDPQDDMISILATSTLQPDDRPLTHGEMISILNQFLVAGHETTTSTFGWGMLALCENPQLQETLRANPDLTRTFVEEVLRYESPVQGLPRLVTKDTELGGYPIKAGQMVMLRYGAANRDERQFPDPDVVDLHRPKAGMQLAFGSGIHHCIGAPLARQELNLGFPALLERMRNIRLSEAHPPPVAEPSFILRNVPQLYITFDRN